MNRRRSMSICLLFLFLIVNISSVFAEALSFDKKSIYGTGYSILLPTSWLYGDRNVEEDAPILKRTGLSAKSFATVLDNNQTCFFAVSEDYYTSLQLAISETDQEDFSSRTDDEILEIARAYSSYYSDDYTVEDVDVCSSSIYKYGRVVLYRAKDNTKHFHCFTVEDGKIFSFIMECHSSDPDSYKDLMKEIIGTLAAE